MEEILWSKISMMLIVAAGLCVLWIYFQKKQGFFDRKTPLNLRILGYVYVSPKERLMVIRYHNKEVVVGLSPSGMHPLSERVLSPRVSSHLPEKHQSPAPTQETAALKSA